ncbi:VWA domain-containing protein [Pseudomonas benzenivorans]|uniref:VWA domain-containing protein n=1 Tax=Pseudomonas benzenivorans TaxID=556533 RepID=A0ABY5HCG0_9PSED|nr:VWA domain-containing protein [Pseudomonas benzenivorans]UTW09970.1 VWA domain-containing protein [Pseudomonas benzenivorans]
MEFALWPHWLRPYWLLLTPLLCWLLWKLWHREKRAGRWHQLLPTAFHAALLRGGKGRASRLPWVALGLAWLLALLALLGPSWQRLEQSTLKPADPLVVLLELTPEMLASDAAPNRLEQARRKVLDLLEARRDAQTAIVVYAGSAHTLVPLSDDLTTSRNLLEALKPSIMPEPGRRADRAVAKALKLLDQGSQGQGRLLLIASALDEQERRGIRDALDDRRERLHILGIGTPQGAPIVQEDGSFLKDRQGAILIPRLDNASLNRLAQDVGGRYQRVSLNDRDLRSLGLLERPQQLRSDGDPTPLHAWSDQGYWLLLPLLLLAACAGRRGWLFCLPLMLLSLPQPGFAASLDDLWLRPDQQGQRLLEAQRPGEAAKHFEDPQWQGLALYQAGDYAAAAERFAEGDSAAAHYNRGNALAHSNELEAAIEAYSQALELQPDLLQAQKNKALVEQLLQQPPRQAPAEQPSSEPQQANQAPSEQPQNSTPDQDSDSPPPGQPGQDEQPPQPGEGETPTPEEPGQQADGEEQLAAAEPLDGERRQALEQWLRQIPDDPAELLRRKFWYQQQQRQESTR